MTAPYQLLPPLNETELAELAASINEHGVMVPVLVDEDELADWFPTGWLR